MSKELRKQIALDTLEKAEAMDKKRTSHYFSADQMKRLKEDKREAAAPGIKNNIVVLNEDVVNVIMNEQGKVGVLNFASARNPGGGFLNGASAQEESIARVSDLYLYLKNVPSFYKNPKHFKNGLYDSDVIYSEGVTLLKNSKGETIEPKEFDVITSCAVNVRDLKQKKQTDLLKQGKEEMVERIENIIDLAVQHKVETLVLGAFGCGVFENNPYDVKAAFQSVLNKPSYKGKFQKIIFAIYKDDKLFNIFRNIQ